jgi:hypothetical protein
LSVDGCRGVHVVPQIHRQETTGSEVRSVIKGPQRGLERADDIARTLDIRWLSVLKRSTGDRVDLRAQRLPRPQVRDRRVVVTE